MMIPNDDDGATRTHETSGSTTTTKNTDDEKILEASEKWFVTRAVHFQILNSKLHQYVC